LVDNDGFGFFGQLSFVTRPDDLMAGVDATIAKGFVDTTHMAVSGCSGGGVLSNG
jgi:dipeptidyl aminopeptidase/acylaminoacyl peptidase